MKKDSTYIGQFGNGFDVCKLCQCKKCGNEEKCK